MSQGNDMVSGDRNCNDDSELIIDDPSSHSHYNDLSLDANTSCNNIVMPSCIDNPCISLRNTLSTTLDYMLDMPCCHDKNANISSSCCVSNNVEEIKYFMGQDVIMCGAPKGTSSFIQM
jgi:hypothetical protein